MDGNGYHFAIRNRSGCGSEYGRRADATEIAEKDEEIAAKHRRISSGDEDDQTGVLSDEDGSGVSDDVDVHGDSDGGSDDTISSASIRTESAELLVTVANDDVPATKSLLERRRFPQRFINGVDDRGRTALHVATERNCVEIVRVLLENGADRSMYDNTGRTALETAMDRAVDCSRSGFMGHEDVFEALTHAKDDNGRTALHIFAQLNNVPTVEKLLKHGADIARVDYEGQSPLVSAVIACAWDAARLILESRRDVVLISRCDYLMGLGTGILEDEKRRTAEAADILNFIFQARTEGGAAWTCVDIMGNTPTHVYSGLTNETIKLRMEVNSRNGWGQTPLHLAINRGDGPYAKRLLELGADINVTDALQNTPSHYWNKHLDKGLLESVIPHTAHGSHNVNIFGQISPLLLEGNHVEKSADGQANTALHIAAGFYEYVNGRLGYEEGNKMGDFVAYLTDYDELMEHDSPADFGIQNMFGLTPLHVLAINSEKPITFPDCAKDYLTTVDGRGRNVLHLEILTEECHLFGLCDIEDAHCRSKKVLSDQLDYCGRTPLHYAAMTTSGCFCNFGQGADSVINCKRCLEYFGINCLTINDIYSRTPVHYASMFGRSLSDEILACLPHSFIESSRDVDGFTPAHLGSQASRFLTPDEGNRRGWLLDDGRSYQHLAGIEHLVGRAQIWEIWTKEEPATKSTETPMHPSIDDVVNVFMKRLAAAISEEVGILQCEVLQVGSAYDGTKLALDDEADEFDFNVVLTKFGDMCQVVTSSKHPAGFVILKRRQADFHSDNKAFEEFFNDDGTLNTTQLNFEFQKALIKVLSWQKFWDGEQWMEMINIKKLYHISPMKLGKTIKLITCRSVAGKPAAREVNIDIVPVIHIPGWWPAGARPVSDLSTNEEVRTQLLTEGCNFVFDQPYEKYLIPYTPTQFVKISFARAEGILMRSLAALAQAALMTGKHVLHLVSKWNASYAESLEENDMPSLKSFVLKTSLFYSLVELNMMPCREKDSVIRSDLETLVERIFYHFYQFAVQDYVPTFMMPSFHIPVFPFETYLGMIHTVLDRIPVSYEEVCRMVDTDVYRVYTDLDLTKAALEMSYVAYVSVCKNGGPRAPWVWPSGSAKKLCNSAGGCHGDQNNTTDQLTSCLNRHLGTSTETCLENIIVL